MSLCSLTNIMCFELDTRPVLCIMPHTPSPNAPLGLRHLLLLLAGMAPLNTHLSVVISSHLLTLSIFLASLEGKSQASWWLYPIHHCKNYNSPSTQIQHDETHGRAFELLSRVTKYYYQGVWRVHAPWEVLWPKTDRKKPADKFLSLPPHLTRPRRNGSIPPL